MDWRAWFGLGAFGGDRAFGGRDPRAGLARAVVFAPAVVLTVSLVVLGRGVPAPEHVEFTDETVRLVQPNAPQNEKWLPEKRWVFFERLLALTAADGEVDLTVWPETAVPSLLNYADEFVQPMVQVSGGGAILYGVQREDAGQYHNSAVLMGAEGQSLDIYDKMHLVPFGEYMPLSDLAARFGVFGLAARAQSGYAPGAERRLLDLPVGRALVLICYEGVFGQDVRDFEDRADLMVLITNDAWFGLAAGPQQHLVQAQMRAAEQGLPMVRVANTGISAMIDPWGRLRVQLPLNEAGFVDAALPAPLPETFYARTGDWYVSVLSCFCVVCGSLYGLSRRNRRGILTG
jgi:apolipoprotein N-acyltransferase